MSRTCIRRNTIADGDSGISRRGSSAPVIDDNMRAFSTVIALAALAAPATAGQHLKPVTPDRQTVIDYCGQNGLSGLPAASCGFGAYYGVKTTCPTGKAMAVSCSISDLSWDMKVNAISESGDTGVCVWGRPFGWNSQQLPTATASVLCSDETVRASAKRLRRSSR